ncbi:hypothetical protein C9I36_11685 [Pectobacterium punjabense]|nr:hypothetical protein [Pectobacterium punjabense]PTA64048.1 hypothetical protein C9I36_11685 [Pectobacterium punjabense]
MRLRRVSWRRESLPTGCKLESDLAAAIAGGVGVAKAGAALTERVVAKVVGKAESAVNHSVVSFPTIRVLGNIQQLSLNR